MLKFELSNKDPIYNFERWYYRLPKKPFIISNAGIGDLIISARIAKYLNTGVFHFTNHSYRHKFGSEFCNLLNVHYFYDEMRNPVIFNQIVNNKKFNYKKHMDVPSMFRITNDHMNVKMHEILSQDHGLTKLTRNNPRTILICPCASNFDYTKKRYMTREQLEKIINLINPINYKIYLVGIRKDMDAVGHHHKCDWINTEELIRHDGPTEKIDMLKFVETVGTASMAITTDTFLTHLTGIFKIPTIVLYKYNQENEPMTHNDGNDRFFLNANWYKHFTRSTYEDLYASLEKGIHIE
jgi:ADP-heptose:LPS heptosyltransferase